MNTYFQGVWRMDWGLGNPNKTAALIAMLMISVWLLVFVRKIGFWLPLLAFTILGICLMHTVSRGGLVAVSLGLVILIWNVPRPWPSWNVFAVVGSFWIIIGASIFLQTYSRYSEGFVEKDPSIANRIELWKTAPRMMLDAPKGWGLGNSGRAYMDWYQPLSRHEEYRTLVNNHLTWLVELSWPLRFCYLFAWFSVLTVCCPNRRSLWRAIPFAVWVAFCVAAFFSSVAESWILWIVPSGCLLIAIRDRYVHKTWPGPFTWSIPALLSIVALVGLLLSAPRQSDLIVHGSSDNVIVGGDSAKTWILVNPKVIGHDYARVLRKHLPSYPVGVITSLRSLPADATGRLIVFGELGTDDLSTMPSVATRFTKITLVNPSFYPQQLKMDDSAKYEAVFGEYSQSPSLDAWQNLLGKPCGRLAGVGNYLPKWTLILDSGGG